MDPSSASSDGPLQGLKEKEAMVDPFLVEALQNPRHRLTILRMELDVEKFLLNPDQQVFEFQHFPTSYLRLAAHRVAQHYGLQTMVQETSLDGQGNRILVRKTLEAKYPPVRLSEIPAKQFEINRNEQIKIAIKPRPNRTSENAPDGGLKRSSVRSVEERKEEYDRARARIFSTLSSPESVETLSQAVTEDEKHIRLSSMDESEGFRTYNTNDVDKNISGSDSSGTASRVAIYRDREKDRSDPDYDRSYERYVRNLPTNQSINMAPFFSMQKMQGPFQPYDTGYSAMGHMPRAQGSVGYGPSSSPVVSPFCAFRLNQSPRDAAYVQWQSAAMMYAHSHNQFRHAVFQAPFCQQPLSFDNSQNH